MARFCTNCGKQLNEGAAFCDGCGHPINAAQAVNRNTGIQNNQPPQYNYQQQYNQQQYNQQPAYNPYATPKALVEQLSSKCKILAIIWGVIAAIQIILGIIFLTNAEEGMIYGISVLVCAVVNIIFVFTTYQFSNQILVKPVGIVQRYKPIGNIVVTLIYNILFGGLIGVAGSIYSFVLRNFVIAHENEFAAMETRFTTTHGQRTPSVQYVDKEARTTQQENFIVTIERNSFWLGKTSLYIDNTFIADIPNNTTLSENLVSGVHTFTITCGGKWSQQFDINGNKKYLLKMHRVAGGLYLEETNL